MFGTEIVGGRTGGSDLQGSADHPECRPTAALVKQARREPGLSIIDLEGETGLGRGESVHDPGFGETGAKPVEDRLVGDFTGEPDILRSEAS